MAEFSSQALESTIELAAQATRLGPSSSPSRCEGEIFSFGRDEVLVTNEDSYSQENAYLIESDRCYICRGLGHWSRSCPYNRPNNLFRKIVPPVRGRDRHPPPKNNQPKTTNQSTQQYVTSKKNNIESQRTQGKVFVTEEEKLQSYQPDIPYDNEEEIFYTDDNYLQDYIQHEFNEKNTTDSKLNEPQEQ